MVLAQSFGWLRVRLFISSQVSVFKLNSSLFKSLVLSFVINYNSLYVISIPHVAYCIMSFFTGTKNRAKKVGKEEEAPPM